MEFVCEFDCILALLQVRACDHHLGDTSFEGSFDDLLEIIVVGLLAVMHATIYLISKVDADLSGVWSVI
jgi:hypothetical protein